MSTVTSCKGDDRAGGKAVFHASILRNSRWDAQLDDSVGTSLVLRSDEGMVGKALACQ